MMLINMLGFNLIWFGLLYWGNIFIPVALTLLFIHFKFLSKIIKEIRLVLLVTVIGVSVDSFLHFIHFFTFPNANFTPFWLMVLWACFASTICHSLTFLSASKKSQLLIGGGFAPLSYLAGESFGVVVFAYSLPVTFSILAIIWGCLFLLFFYLKSIILQRDLQYA
ncbi:DUF2878 domain-containing protein [Psychromonas sp. 14N.309.X.WAT.B.A12]|uniref:DUF2878 domain-containing protein n=1 Tax=unclassified Psychromonas TaxID=2614957 RepID=UPI0025B018A1|nr:DUF2878 domain-containing protein [Psychromonas sp. 14N.309.X.WAT.B.A12]MDN2662229.1 DUF2878 domain-containing protein [Psychromonas sp. 14N.309.X.WAT.B.A12]